MPSWPGTLPTKVTQEGFGEDQPQGAVYGLGLGLSGFTGQVALAAGFIGAGLVVGGVSTLLSGNPHGLDPAERPENRPSFLFNGPVNTTAQGHPVPVGYGRLRVGSAVISAGITTTDIAP